MNDEPVIEGMQYDRERGLRLQARHPAFAALIKDMAEWFGEEGGQNYVELTMWHQQYGHMIVTVQRQDGKTPAMLAQEAFAARDAMRSVCQAVIVAEDSALEYFTHGGDDRWRAWQKNLRAANRLARQALGEA